MNNKKIQILKEKVQEHPVIYGAFVLFLCILVGKIVWHANSQAFSQPELLETEALVLEESVSSSSIEEWIYVDIKGEVNYPGVYQVDVDCRLLDLIDKAGGLTNKANAQKVNMAQKLSDQAMIIIPSIDEEGSQITEQVEDSVIQTPDTQSGKINLNTATIEELTSLSGIGIKKAQQIIEYREKNGSFKTIDDLVNVSGIGQKTVDKLKSEVCV